MEIRINLTRTCILFIVALLILSNFSLADSYQSSLHSPTVPDSMEGGLGSQLANDLFTGAAVYSYPMSVPPGTNGLQPSLALSYNSHSRNSYPELTGSAWSFTGSYVQRDVEHTPGSTGDDTFKLVLDGVPHDLVYDASDGRYHTDVESYLSISFFSGAPNTYGQFWDVRTRDGTRYRFGLNTESELTSNQHSYAWRWYLDDVEDTQGNKIFYSYSENPFAGDLGVTYLDSIEYNNGKERNITFAYEPLPTSWDIYDNGQKVKRTHRLETVSMYADTFLVREYDLEYLDTGTRSYVSSITEKGTDGTALPPTTFNYFSLTKGWTSTSTWIPVEDAAFSDWDDGYDEGVRAIDFNRDGREDLVKRRDCTSATCRGAWMNNGAGWSTAASWETPSAAPYIDVHSVGDDYYSEDLGVRFGDVNGDGLVDILSRGTCSSCDDAWLNTGSGWSRSASWIPPSGATFVESDGEDEGVRLADVNGDGLVDIVRRKDETGGSGAWLNTGSGWSSDASWITPSGATFVESDGEDEGVRLADVNGDGLVDIVRRKDETGGSGAWINTGSGWVSDASWIPPSSATFTESDGSDEGVRIADINGDGMVDLVKRQDCTSVSCKGAWINNGHGWSSDLSWYPSSYAAFVDDDGDNEGVRLADANGDGLVDIIKREDCSSADCKGSWMNRAAKAYLLHDVVDRMGGTLTLDYGMSTAYDNTGDDSISDIGFNLWVVTSVVRDNGLIGLANNVQIKTYSYSGGLYDYDDDELRGFSFVEETIQNHTLVEHRFYQDDVLKGIEYRASTYDLEDNVYGMTEHEFGTIDEGGYYIVTDDSTTEYIYDGNPVDPLVKTTLFDYDAYGNVIKKSVLGFDSVSGDEVYEYAGYVVNEAAWILSAPIHITIYAADDFTKLRETKFSYDDLPYGSPPLKGDVTSKEYWLDTGTDPIEYFVYDSYGNIVVTTDARGYETSYVYDSTHTYVVSETNALLHETVYARDLGTGNLITETDPNDLITEYFYDVFGRLVKKVLPYDSEVYPTVEIVYGFDGSAPELVTTKTRETSGLSGTHDEYAYYDGFGSAVQTKSETESGFSAKDYYYGFAGKITKVSNPYSSGTSVYTAPVFTFKTEYDYDALSRIIEVTDNYGFHTDMDYSRDTITVNDNRGHDKDFINDAHGNIIAVIEHNGPGITYTTEYTYDDVGSLETISDQEGNVWTNIYDSLGRKVYMDDPDMGDWSFSYDAAGNMISEIDSRGITVTYIFDELGRILSKQAGGKQFTYGYDDIKIGTLSSVNSSQFTKQMLYDNRLRLAEQTMLYADGSSFTESWQYDAMDRVISEELPSGDTIDYSYDSSGIDSISGVIIDVIHNANGQPTARHYVNSLTTSMTYDDQFRFDSIITPGLQNIEYSYDGNSNVVELNDVVGAQVIDYEYDWLDRLISADSSGGVEYNRDYVYSSIGNMISMTDSHTGVSVNSEYLGSPVAHSPNSVTE